MNLLLVNKNCLFSVTSVCSVVKNQACLAAFRGVTFAHPNAFWLFFFFPILIAFFFFHFLWKKDVAKTLGDTFSPLQENKNGIISLFGWMFLILALMSPEGYPTPERKEGVVTKTRQQELLFVIDTSASMGVNDAQRGKERLEEAKSRIHEIMEQFPGREYSLYALSKGWLPLVPPTTDRLFFSLILDRVAINEGGLYGSDYRQGIEELAQAIVDRGEDRATIVFLLSDGEDLQIASLPQGEQKKAVQAIADTLPSPMTFSYALYAVAIGTEKGGVVPGVVWKGKSVVSHRDIALFQALAKKGDGTVFPFAESSFFSWLEAIQTKERAMERFSQQEEIILHRGTPFYQIPLLCSLFFFLLAIL